MSNVASSSEAQQLGTIWPQCVARAWLDTQFREALKSDPASTLRESYQFSVPAGVQLQVIEGNAELHPLPENTLRMLIPPAPDMEMREVALVGPDARAMGGDGTGSGARVAFCLC